VCERVVGDACGVEAVLREADRRPEPRAAGPHHHRVVRVVHHRVGRLESTKRPTTQHNTNEKINRRIPRRATKKLLKKNRRMSAKERRGEGEIRPNRDERGSRHGREGEKGWPGRGVPRPWRGAWPWRGRSRRSGATSRVDLSVVVGFGAAAVRGGEEGERATRRRKGRGGEERRLAEVGGKKIYRIRFLYNIVGLYFLFIM
jgi:hypothetical protein